MPIRLTDHNIKTLPKGDHADAIMPGLVLRAGAKARSFRMRARVRGKLHQEPLGRYPKVALADARDQVANMIRRLEKGLPARLEEAAPAPAPSRRGSAKLSLGGGLDKYEAYRKLKGTRTKNLAEQMRHLRRSLEPWAGVPLSEFKKADLREARDIIAKRGSLGSSNKLLAYASSMLDWAAKEDLVETNFARDIIRLGAAGKRDRFLDDEEIGLLWRGTHGTNTASFAAFCRLVRVAVLTGARRGELATMTWADVDGVTWHQLDNKASRPCDIHLPDLARAQMNGGESGLVFQGVSGGMSGWGPLKKRLDKQCRITEPWVVHDLRRSFASGLMRLGVDREVIAGCLNHSQPGVTSLYMRDKLEPQKREAWEAWSSHVGGLVQ